MSKLLGDISGKIGLMLNSDYAQVEGLDRRTNLYSRIEGHPSNTTLSKSLISDALSPSASVEASRNIVVGIPHSITGGKTVIDFSTTQLTELFGDNHLRFPEVNIGAHPDFVTRIPNDSMMYHHCVSVFVDIKGSTRLINKVELPHVRRIKDTLLTACGHVANFFGGHVHRLQGDAAFLQFVRFDKHPNHSIINALNAATVLCHFVSETLADEFTNNGYDPLKIRIGIDYGRDTEVLWSHYGRAGATELTTTSLHTDLAAKLQAQAANNEVRIGHNVIEALDLPEEFWERVYDANNRIDYIFTQQLDSGTKNYAQYKFNWRKFLLSYDFAAKNGDRIEIIDDPNPFRIVLKVYKAGIFNSIYKPNSLALPKNNKLVYALTRGGFQYERSHHEVVEWQIENRGSAAKNAGALGHNWVNDSGKYPEFNTSTSYLGHHYMNCRIHRRDNMMKPVLLKFPLFIQ